MNKSENKISPDLSGSDFQEFLTALLNFESGLDQNLLQEYIDNYDNPDYIISNIDTYVHTDGIRYPIYTGSGQAPGEPVRKDYTLKEYFQFLNVDDIWNSVELGEQTSSLLYKMQCSSLNAWNFVGYQLGEAVLIDAGHYNPSLEVWSNGENYNQYYIYQDEHVWSADESDIRYLYHIPGTPDGAYVIATRSNTWLGTFTGTDGISSLEDLKVERNMELAMRDVIWRNIDYIEKRLSDSDISMTWEEVLAKSWVNPVTQETVESSMSGIIAGAHLSGAEACVQLLKNDTVLFDETGTSILTYFQKFGGATTIVDEPGNNTILTGTAIPERFSCGAGDEDDLDTGSSGNNYIQVYTDRNPGVIDSTSVQIRNLNIDVAGGANDTILISKPVEWLYESPSAVQSGPNAIIYINRSEEGTEGSKALVIINGDASAINEVIESIVLFSTEYPFSWSRSYSDINFNFPGDLFTIGDAGGLTYSNLLIDRTDPINTKVGVLDIVGSSYFGYRMLGTAANEVNAYMFKPGIGGSFADIKRGVSVNVNDFGSEISLSLPSDFIVSQEGLYVSGYQASGGGTPLFIECQYQEDSGNVWFFPNGMIDQYGHYIIIPNATWEQCVQFDMIHGFEGEMSDVPLKA